MIVTLGFATYAGGHSRSRHYSGSKGLHLAEGIVVLSLFTLSGLLQLADPYQTVVYQEPEPVVMISQPIVVSEPVAVISQPVVNPRRVVVIERPREVRMRPMHRQQPNRHGR